MAAVIAICSFVRRPCCTPSKGSLCPVEPSQPPPALRSDLRAATQVMSRSLEQYILQNLQLHPLLLGMPLPGPRHHVVRKLNQPCWEPRWRKTEPPAKAPVEFSASSRHQLPTTHGGYFRSFIHTSAQRTPHTAIWSAHTEI